MENSLSKIDPHKANEDAEIVRHLLIDTIMLTLKHLLKKSHVQVNVEPFETIAMGELNRLKIYLSKHQWTKLVKNI